jgi:ferritin
MAIWADAKGYKGTADFMFQHADEERMHMIKLVKFLGERGGDVIVTSIEQPRNNFKNIDDVFQLLLEHEMMITNSINEIVHETLLEKDYTTNHFLQWYVSEQLEEEALARTILDRLKLIGGADSAGLYLFDRDIATLKASSEANVNPPA